MFVLIKLLEIVNIMHIKDYKLFDLKKGSGTKATIKAGESVNQELAENLQ